MSELSQLSREDFKEDYSLEPILTLSIYKEARRVEINDPLNQAVGNVQAERVAK